MFLLIFILLLFFFLFFLPTLFFSVIARILSIFNFGSKKKRMYEKREPHDDSTSYTYTRSSKKHKEKKIFDKDEGEYVDFEEIK